MIRDRQQRARDLADKRVFVSCIVPVFNEATLIQDFLNALTIQLQQVALHFEVIVVDDGSLDRTFVLLEQLAAQNTAIKLLRFSRNFGKEHAIAAGLAYCHGEVGIILDADFQHPVATIPLFLEKWAEGHDMVYGLPEDRQTQSAVRRFLSRLFYKILRTTTKINIPAHAGDFRLISRSAIDALNQCEERTRFMKGLYAWIGYPTAAVPFKVAQRPSGKSAHHYRRLTELALTGLISFSDLPLRIWGLIGLVISFISFCSALYIILDTLFHGPAVPGYATIIVTVIFFGGIQLLSIGILGEYIARIFHEVKRRPPYIVEKSVGMNDRERS